MTPYELLCDDRTTRVNDNVYVRGGVMFYMSDEEFERALFELKMDLVRLAKGKKK